MDVKRSGSKAKEGTSKKTPEPRTKVRRGRSAGLAAKHLTTALRIRCRKKNPLPAQASDLPSLHAQSHLVRVARKIDEGVKTDVIRYAPKNEYSTFKRFEPLAGKAVERLFVSEKRSVFDNLIRYILWSDNIAIPVETRVDQWESLNLVPGRVLEGGPCGPAPARVMLVGTYPSADEATVGKVWSDDRAEDFFDAVRKTGIDPDSWYVTNRMPYYEFNIKGKGRKVHSSDADWLLHQQIRLVGPEFILLAGADAVRAVLGVKAKLTELQGSVIDWEYGEVAGGPTKKCKVMVSYHPRNAEFDDSIERHIQRTLQKFAGVLKGNYGTFEEVVDHRCVASMLGMWEELKESERLLDNDLRLIGLDAEWHGEHPVNDGAYCRTIQLSVRRQTALTLKLHEQGGVETSLYKSKDWIPMFNTFLRGGEYTFMGETVKFRRKRAVGHFFTADLEWFEHLGVDALDIYRAPATEASFDKLSHRLQRLYAKDGYKSGDRIPAWVRTKYEGGLDTSLMTHAIEETSTLSLEEVCGRHINAPRWDDDLNAYKAEHYSSSEEKKAMGGYGNIPDEILIPYGNYDADCTLRLVEPLSKLLDEDYCKVSCREAFWESQFAAPAALQIQVQGLRVDTERLERFTKAFQRGRVRQKEVIRASANWPEMKGPTVFETREYFFGSELNGLKRREDGLRPVKAPAGAVCLDLQPVLDTSKRQMAWEQVIERGQEKVASPSTNKNALALLAAENPDALLKIQEIQDYRLLDHVLLNVLRPPSDEGGQLSAEESWDDGEPDGAILGAICKDGKVRTRVRQTLDTARWAMRNPNMQNVSKQKDPDYRRVLGDDYFATLRSMFVADDDYILIEADYIGAELFGMAVMSGDPKMLAHAKRNQLPEDHPDAFDIHSSIAVRAFKLDCPATKQGLKDAGYLSLRQLAKTVIFGIAYGRQAKALAQQCREMGDEVTVEEAQQVIDGIFEEYPGLVPLFEECQSRAVKGVEGPDGKHYRWLSNCFNRRRRFPRVEGRMKQGEFQRQAMNYPLQSMIAGVTSRAAGRSELLSQKLRKSKGVDVFSIVLQIHDSLVFHVHKDYVRWFVDKALPYCMRDSVPIRATNLSGEVLDETPHFLGVDGNAYRRWGEALAPEDYEKLQLPKGLYGKPGCTIEF